MHAAVAHRHDTHALASIIQPRPSWPCNLRTHTTPHPPPPQPTGAVVHIQRRLHREGVDGAGRWRRGCRQRRRQVRRHLLAHPPARAWEDTHDSMSARQQRAVALRRRPEAATVLSLFIAPCNSHSTTASADPGGCLTLRRPGPCCRVCWRPPSLPRCGAGGRASAAASLATRSGSCCCAAAGC